ncbi:hypothetical protein [Geobacillus sp. YHL]|uniref:hypothetical protein n=1 Tax=Geobacillus sp. YHL TaxID=2796117 RepID=UPI001EEFC589|nr:hypothetical protein [Geobacillus sp. YHL]MCG6796365.1 hypothetical protein [Geobacillus sp. YHL]
MKDLNKMIGTIMKETGFNYEFIVNGLTLKEFEDLYLECSKEELVSEKQKTDKLVTKLKNQLGCSHHFAVEIVRNEETRKMVIDGLLDLVNELKALEVKS